MSKWQNFITAVIITACSSTAMGGIKGTVIFESSDTTSSTVKQFQDDGTLAPLDQRTQTLNPGIFVEVPDLTKPQKVLVLLVGPYWQAKPLEEVRALFEGENPNSLKNFYARNSSGSVSFESFTFFSVPSPGHNGCQLGLDQQLARYTEASGDRKIDFDHVFNMGSYIGGGACLGISSTSGAHAVLGKVEIDNQYGKYKLTSSWYPENDIDNGTINHEFGHQIGWLHSNSSSLNFHEEYGDRDDLMGRPVNFDYRVSAIRKWSQGWPVNGVNTIVADGAPVIISNRSGPELLLVEVPRTQLKTSHYGRSMLALTIEPAIPYGTGLPWRRAGLLPRIVTTGLPFATTSVLVDSVRKDQIGNDLVLDVGTYNILEAGVQVVVDWVGANGAQVRVISNNQVSPVWLSSAASSMKCYHRHFQLNGAPSNAFTLAQDGTASQAGILRKVASNLHSSFAMFAGAGPYSVSTAVEQLDGSTVTYNFQEPANPNCTEAPPKLVVEQTRQEGFYTRSCGAINITAQNLGSFLTKIYGGLGTNDTQFNFYGSTSKTFLGIDNRKILSSFWSDDDGFAIGSTTLAPVNCSNQPIPELQLNLTSISADCKTVNFKVSQSAPGIISSIIGVTASLSGVPAASSGSCTVDGELAGSQDCVMNFVDSVAGKKFNAIARSPSDSTALQGVLSCN